jgi:hypothetical protein
LKYFFNSIISFHSSLVTSGLKCYFKQSIDLRDMAEHNISLGSKCLPDIILGSPPNDIATEPFFLRAYVNFL